MRVKDIMTRDVVSIDKGESVRDAARLMVQNHVSGLPVVDQHGKLVGMVSEEDFLEHIVEPGLTDDCTVAEVMTPSPHTVGEEDTLHDLVEKMQRHRVKRLPVMSNGRMVGIVSMANLIAHAPWRISYVEHLVTRWPDR